jgi:predicted tellurium resistance membrane protein TerC
VARDDLPLLISGLALSVVLMGVLGGMLARMLDRYRIIAYVGIALIAYVGIELIWDGVAAANEALHLGLPIAPPAHHH